MTVERMKGEWLGIYKRRHKNGSRHGLMISLRIAILLSNLKKRGRKRNARDY
jgi:hypothetical protein